MITDHELVILIEDIPAENLKAGDAGTVVRADQGKGSFDVEFFSPDGETSRIVTVAARHLTLHEEPRQGSTAAARGGGARRMQVKANGITVHYELTGAEEAPVVMLCHSLGATLGMWDAQMGSLTQRYGVLRYDLRGHGGTDATSGSYTMDMLADDALALLDVLGIHSCHFVGLSLGGMVGQALALRKAQPLVGLTLCATSSRIAPEAQPIWDDRIHTAQSQGMAAVAPATLDRWLSQDFQQRAPEEAQRIRNMIENTPVAGFVGCAHAIRNLNFTERLKDIDLPTLVLVGKDDPSTPVATSEIIQREIKGATLVVLDRALHLCNIEQAQAFNDSLRGFLDKLEPGHHYAGH
ncbi:MAG: 3-oxoadipate enol-lactonase [Pseudomonadota bacterium]|nr:3-oxoadipate enol-lactonase [Pseudomonadota bacterium]